MNQPGHEPPAVWAGSIVMVAAGLAAVIGIVLAISMAVTTSMAGSFVSPPPFPLDSHVRDDAPAPPRLEAIERLSGRPAGIHADTLRRSGGTSAYGWVDRERGIVKIPVERAMKILVEEKRLPVR